jgi:hypothetical protein
VQLHLEGTTVRRLAVHAGLAGQSQSRVADRILADWLSRHGQGKELFPTPDPGGLTVEAGPEV